MELNEMVKRLGGRIIVFGSDKEIVGLSSDSRRCKKGDLFFCKGKDFKSEYAVQSAKNGAAAIVSETGRIKELTDKLFRFDISVIEVQDVAVAMAMAAQHFFGYPMKHLKSIAVTGTKGKTTTACMINSILNQRDGIKSALLSDMTPKDAPRLTTPEAIDFQYAAAKALETGCTHLVCEISSQAEKTGRIHGLLFDYGCFLNLGRDHVGEDEHENEEDYFLCKAAVIEKSRSAIINIDTPHGKRLLQMLWGGQNIIRISADGAKADYFCKNICADAFGCGITVAERDMSEISLFTPLVGRHYALNVLCAYAVCRQIGVGVSDARTGIEAVRPAGRSEIIYGDNKKTCVVVDYAHNEMSLIAMAKTARDQLGAKTVTAVFGCPGNKAQCRRYQLALACTKNVDKAVICEDDSGSEGYERIKKEMTECFIKAEREMGEDKKLSELRFIENREEALRYAVKNAISRSENEVILLLGKGDEQLNRGAFGEVRYEGDGALARRVLESCALIKK